MSQTLDLTFQQQTIALTFPRHVTIGSTGGGGGSGTVTSVAVSGGTTGLTTSGGPITTAGTITLAGTLAVANGGTGSTTAANARTALGLGTLATQSGTFSGTSSGTNTGDQTITLTGDVTGSGTASFAATIANDAVTNAKLANMSASTIKARKTGSTGDPEDCTLSEVLDLVGSAAQGDILYRGASGWVRLAAGTSGHYLQTQGAAANPQWAAVSGGGTKTFESFTPLDAAPPASNFATLDTRNSIYVLEFDKTTDESTTFIGVIPQGANLSSGILVRIVCTADTATTGQYRLGVQFERMVTDLDSDSFDTATEANTTTDFVSGEPTVTEITVTFIDSLTAGDAYRLKVYREPSDTVNDTLDDDLQIHLVELQTVA